MRIHLEIEVRRVQFHGCGKMEQEKFPWLTDNPFFTKRLAWSVGRQCRENPGKDVARALKLDWKTVKSLDQEYMREQFRRTETLGPRASALTHSPSKMAYVPDCSQ